MRNWKQKVPALVLSAALLTSFAPALPGGRDVPDRKSDSSSSSETYVLPGDGTVSCPVSGITTRLSLGLVSLDVVTMPDGSWRIQPSLFTEATRFFQRFLDTDAGDNSCPTR